MKAKLLRSMTTLLVVASFCSQLVFAQSQVEFTLRKLQGGSVSSEGLRGSVVLLAFGASWLPLSRDQIQGISKLADRFGDRGLKIYWVATDSESSKSKNYATDDQLRDFARRAGLNVPVLRDPDGATSRRLGVDQLPSLVILDKQGNIDGSPIGGIDPSVDLVAQLQPRLDRLL